MYCISFRTLMKGIIFSFIMLVNVSASAHATTEKPVGAPPSDDGYRDIPPSDDGYVNMAPNIAPSNDGYVKLHSAINILTSLKRLQKRSKKSSSVVKTAPTHSAHTPSNGHISAPAP